jgi:hypothetical protein
VIGDVVLEGEGVLEGVRMGVDGTMEEMEEEACRAVLFREFTKDFVGGYETVLGGRG